MQAQQLPMLQAQHYEEQSPEILSGQQDLQTTLTENKKHFALHLDIIRLFYVLRKLVLFIISRISFLPYRISVLFFL